MNLTCMKIFTVSYKSLTTPLLANYIPNQWVSTGFLACYLQESEEVCTQMLIR